MNKEAVKKDELFKVIIEKDNGTFDEFEMSLPLQMLFDDVITFVSKTDFE